MKDQIDRPGRVEEADRQISRNRPQGANRRVSRRFRAGIYFSFRVSKSLTCCGLALPLDSFIT
jgi:hypothetical protein